ncbi:MAG: nitrite transporter [Methylobacteriaceae bacterium]|jgi:nitrite transporter NirC|nr:nitrite transporter [Methylobacteriaceae bacterium]
MQTMAAMFQDTIDKFTLLGEQKARFLRDNPLGFWISSMMAGIYVGFGILLIFSIGSALDPSVRPLAMGASFGLALILVIFAGSDLFTGHTMSLTISGLQGGTSWNNVLSIWAVSWLGNLAGCLFLAALFVGGGGGLITGAASELIYKVAAAKMNADAFPLICRAILCNWLVCLAVWMSMRITSEAGRMIAIAWCLFAFIGSGYEHSIANMTIFGVALLSKHPDNVTWAGMVWNLIWVTLGNTIAGAGLMAAAYWTASRPSGFLIRPVPQRHPAE